LTWLAGRENLRGAVPENFVSERTRRKQRRATQATTQIA
jgi:hypothetical protein